LGFSTTTGSLCAAHAAGEVEPVRVCEGAGVAVPRHLNQREKGSSKENVVLRASIKRRTATMETLLKGKHDWNLLRLTAHMPSSKMARGRNNRMSYWNGIGIHAFLGFSMGYFNGNKNEDVLLRWDQHYQCGPTP
jgi:hypothetical protein